MVWAALSERTWLKRHLLFKALEGQWYSSEANILFVHSLFTYIQVQLSSYISEFLRSSFLGPLTSEVGYSVVEEEELGFWSPQDVFKSHKCFRRVTPRGVMRIKLVKLYKRKQVVNTE